MSKIMAGNNPVRVVPITVRLPIGFYKQLQAAADDREITVGEMVATLAQIGVQRKKPVVSRGDLSYYNFDVGRAMLRMKELNRSNLELAAHFGVSNSSVKRWLDRAEQELRAHISRDAA